MSRKNLLQEGGLRIIVFEHFRCAISGVPCDNIPESGSRIPHPLRPVNMLHINRPERMRNPSSRVNVVIR